MSNRTAVKVSIPIPDYIGEDIYQYDLYFNNTPTKEQVLENLQDILDKYKGTLSVNSDDAMYRTSIGAVEMAIKATNDVSKWQWVIPGHLTGTNTHVDVECPNSKNPNKIVRAPYSWSVITIHSN